MTEELVAHVARETIGTTTVERDGETIDLTPPWRRVTLRDAILEETGIDIAQQRDRETLLARDATSRASNRSDAPGWGKLVDELLSKHVEPKLIQPTFVLDYPVELSPFAKAHRSEPGLVERFEAFIGGVEVANAFSELNDPDEQRRRFEQQQRLRGGRRRGGASLRRGLPVRAGTGHAAGRRHGPGHRPAADDADRPAARSARSCSSRPCASADKPLLARLFEN